ncbi:hypothetical protein NQD34_013116 [Periophthalmus magnuspinnatus]|nr:hypothetical protein NQD34_013116 [Periophthalmus magnuspinnatus]
MYSPVSKYSAEARKRMTYRARKGKSCGYYMRIVFFFSSLIQSLIIVSLVLFLVYGKQQDSASVARIQDMEMRFSQLSLETVSLRQQRRNLTSLLNATVQDMTRNEYDLTVLRASANMSYILLADIKRKLQQCTFENLMGRNLQPELRTPPNPFQFRGGMGGSGCNCAMQMESCRAQVSMIQANFTQTAMKMQMEMDQMAKDRDNINLEAIQLRRDKFLHEKAIELYQIKCKDEFINSLSGIKNVSKAFLSKIDKVFPAYHSFQLTCPKQTEYLEQIRTNCTNLSEEVVRKFQNYLDILGDKVSMSQGNISILTAENMRMTRDYNQCSQNRTGLIREHKQNVERIHLKNDEEKEKLLKEKLKLKGEIEVLESSVKFKNSELAHMKEQLMHLNMSCIPRSGAGFFPRSGNQPGSTWGNTGSSNFGSSNFGSSNSGSSNSGYPNSGGSNQFNRNSFGSSSSSSSSLGSPYGSTGSNSGLGSTNTGFNKPSSTGLGSSSLGSGSSGGLGSSGLNVPGSSNQGSSFGSSFGSNPSSSGTGLNKQTSTGLGTSLFGFGSSNNNPSSSSSNQNKFGSSSASSSNSNFGSSSSSGFGSSNSNQGSTNSKFGSSNSNFGSSNSNFGSSNSNLGSSNSNLGSANSNLGSSNSNFGSNFGSSSNSNLGSRFFQFIQDNI